jgi:nucleotide-binding universal stress UspA family protein
MGRKWLILIIIMPLIAGCSLMTMFKPELAIDKYHRVGVVNFTADSRGNLDELVSEEFLKEIRKASKKAVIIELGDKNKVLESVKEKELSASAINAIAVKNDLDAIIIGDRKSVV